MQYFQTSDKKLFYVEDLAKNHARSLEDKTVKKVDSADLKIIQKLTKPAQESKPNNPATKNTGKPASNTPKKEKEVKDKKDTGSNENLETDVNQDKENSSDVDATQKVDEQKATEAKTDK